MTRRLNACGKGLLGPQSSDSKNDPHAMVGCLHRTVKDYIQKTDIWDTLVNATSPSFDPGMRLAACCITHILSQNSADKFIGLRCGSICHRHTNSSHVLG
jgi:hypothetical protein